MARSPRPKWLTAVPAGTVATARLDWSRLTCHEGIRALDWRC